MTYLSGRFSGGMQMADMYMRGKKKHLTLLTMETYIKIAVKCHFMPFRMIITKKKDPQKITNVDDNVEKMEKLYTAE